MVATDVRANKSQIHWIRTQVIYLVLTQSRGHLLKSLYSKLVHFQHAVVKVNARVVAEYPISCFWSFKITVFYADCKLFILKLMHFVQAEIVLLISTYIAPSESNLEQSQITNNDAFPLVFRHCYALEVDF